MKEELKTKMDILAMTAMADPETQEVIQNNTYLEFIHSFIHSFIHAFFFQNDGPKNDLAAVFAANKASKKIKKSTLGKVPKSCRKNNMDLAKAMGIMGFTSNRWAEKTKGKNPKDELDKAQFTKLMQIQKKKVRQFYFSFLSVFSKFRF